jgi:glycosyltransferase involved in cell wall biosynthesis
MKRKIKVCHIITKMVYGGASLGTLTLAENLSTEIFENTIICGPQSNDEGNLLQVVPRSKLSIIVIKEMVREINPIKDVRLFLKLMHFIKENKYDIIHTHGSKAGVIGRLAAAVVRAPAVLYTVHGWGLKAAPLIFREIFRFVEGILATITTKILFQTEADMKEATLYRVGTQDQYILIGNGIDLNPFTEYDRIRAREIREELKLHKKRVVGTVGRVSPAKNPIGFISIAERLLKETQDVIFLFVGGGEMLDEARRRVRDLHLESDIIFLGVRRDIPELLSNFDVFILPSLWEGMPRSVIEALTLSKPVVAYGVGGLAEIIEDGRNGFIVSLNHIDKFVKSVKYLLENPVLCEKMGRMGRTIAQRYDVSNVVEKTKSLYLQLAARSA